MRALSSSVLAALSLAAVASLLACTVETTKYSSAEALKGKAVPEPPGPLTAGGTPVGERTCAQPIAVNTNCAVKWADIYTTYIKGQWRCADKVCHGTGSLTQPSISDTDPALARRQLAAYVLKGDKGKAPEKFYIDPCSTEPNVSSIICNLRIDNQATCGNGMPLSGLNNVTVTGVTAADVDKIKTWLQCGAPP
ncbi:MAG: hypothetical protein IPG50_07060 [Myxococcales bacterium]|nr:hypothetical protein [Myxococcales bacterium]